MKAPLRFHVLMILCCIPFMCKAQIISISGIISSEKTGKIIENANVFDCQSTIGTISDKFGFYQLLLSSGKIDLLVTGEGYTDFRQKMELKADTTFNIDLKPLHHLKGRQKNNKDLQVSAKDEIQIENRLGLKHTP